MRTTIGAAGRLVIPKEIRRQAGRGPGAQVDVRFENGRIEIEPLTLSVKLIRNGRRVVAVPEIEVPPLTDEVVQTTLDEIRNERGLGA
jgi:AbrB family looped-hinge helix DNA binding protein